MLLVELLKRTVEKCPNAPALTMKMGFRTVSLTYKQVYDTSRQIALLLAEQGIKKGDPVLLLAPNSPYWVCIFWASVLSGAVIVPLNVQSTPEMVEKIAKQVGATIFFAHRYYRHGAPEGTTRYNIELLSKELQRFTPEKFQEPTVAEDDLVEILYTSGTTGDPKGVMLSHKNLYSNVEAISQMVFFDFGADRMLSILPLSHILEQASMLMAFWYGIHTVHAHSYAAIQALLKKHRITKMVAVPEFLKILMGRIEGVAKERGKAATLKKLMNLSLKFKRQCFSRLLFRPVLKKLGGKLDTVISGGAPLDPELEKKWNALGVTLLQGYGLTETSPLLTGNTYERHCFSSVGFVVPNVTARIEDGEIQVKGPNVFQGYFRDEEKTKAAFTDDGWFKTGDMGEFDDDGFLFLKGRKRYMILGPGGQNVFPEDVEEVLNNIEGVKDSAVLGIQQESGMVQIHAVLLPEGEAFDGDRVIEKANSKLASYQHINAHTIWPDDDFPRSATKKVKKEVVLEALRAQEGKKEALPSQRDPVMSLLAQVTGVSRENITLETTLGELQIDSLLRVELIARIEEQFFVLLDDAKLTSQITVARLEKMIREKEHVKPLPPLCRWPRSWWARGLRFLGQHFIFLLMRTFTRFRVKGLENLKGLGPQAVFMPNHPCYFDPVFAAAALPRKFRKRVAFAAAIDVLYGEYKWFAPVAELLFNAFPFPRKEGENIKLGLDYMGQLLDENHSIAVFPEGGVSKDDKLLPFKRGAGLVAVEMKVPVIPVSIQGARKIFPYWTFFPRSRATVTVEFGKPIYCDPDESYVTATERIEAAFQSFHRP